MKIVEDPGLASQTYVFPVVPLQERIWSLTTDGADDPAWNVAVRFQVLGPLSEVRLQEAVDAVVADTEILRTYFSVINGELKQLVSASGSVPIRTVDYSDSLNFEQDLAETSRLEAETAMHMQRYPLLRVVLVRQKADIHYLLVTVHHAIMDGYSIGLLSDALVAAYSTAPNEHPRASGDQALQFADYALWLQKRRDSPEYREDAAYWQMALAGVPAATATSSILRGGARIDSILLPRALTNAAQELSGQLNATFPQTALAVFACAAERLNCCIGVPVACRTEVQLESMIGPFVNYLPLKITCGPTETFEQLLAQIAEDSREALAHSEYRYEDILKAKGLDNESLFDTVFICQRDFVRSREVDGIQLNAIPSVTPGALHKLTVFLVERSDGWRLSCETDARYPAEYGLGLLERYQALLESVCEYPQISVEALRAPSGHIAPTLAPLKEVAKGTSAALSFRMSATQERYWALNRIDPSNSSLNLHIRYAVEGVLDPCAFESALQQLLLRHASLRTYFSEQEGDLWQHVGADTKVPLRYHEDLEEDLSSEAISSLFNQEKQRLFVLEQGPLWSALVIRCGRRNFFSLTLSHSISDGWSCGLLVRELLVLYEATITGWPSVLPPLLSSFGEMADREFGERKTTEFADRLAYWETRLQEPSSQLQLPTDTAPGSPRTAAVRVRDLDPVLSEAVNQLAQDHGVTAATAYAAAYRAVLLKYTGVANVVIASPTANRSPGTENIVGPFADSLLLQASIGGTFETVLQETQQAFLAAVEQAVPLQYMMEGMRHGEAGNGATISLGFMYQDAFVRDLIGEHLTLRTMANPAIESSFDWHMAVISRDGRVTMEFVATRGTMTEGLAAMILEDFELSLSGYVVAPRKQIDRVVGITPRIMQICDLARLQRPEPILSQQPGPARNAAAPPSARTSEMVNVWRRVFNRPRIVAQDDFFALGGHSLLLARLQVAIEKQFGHRIFAADIVVAPTCELLVERMELSGQSNSASRSRVIPLQPEGHEAPLFVISQSLIVRELAEHLKSNQPTYTIQFMQEDVERLGSTATMQQVAALYIEHMRTVRPVGPYRVGGWCVSGWVAYEIAQQLSAAGEDVDLLLILDAWAPNFWKDLKGVTKLKARASYYAHRTSFKFLQQFANKNKLSPTKRLVALEQFLQSKLKTAVERIAHRGPNLQSAETAAFDEMMDSAIASYRALPYTDARVLVFRSSEQPQGGSLPDDMGWYGYVPSEVNIVPLPGDHVGIFSGPGAAMMSKHIVRTLMAAPPHNRPGRSSLSKSSQALLNVPSCP